MFNSYKAIRNKYPQVMLLGVVSFFADIASEMLYPITPIFLTTILGGTMLNVGLIEGFAEGLASFLKTFSGLWSDKISKRKPFILAGYFISALSKPLIGLATYPWHVLTARSFDRLGKGLRSAPRDALIGDYVEAQDRGLAFGWHRSLDTMGAAFGPLLAIALLSLVTHLKHIYFIALIPGLISVFVMGFVKESKADLPTAKAVKLSWQDLTSDFKRFLLFWGLFCMTNSSDAFLILKMKASGLSLTIILVIYAFFNLVYALLSPSLGHLSDQWGRLKILVLGLCVFTVVYLGFAFSSQAITFAFFFGLYGVYMAATEGVSKAYTLDISPGRAKASSIGFLGSVTGISQIIASVITGFVWDYFGATTALLYNAVGSLLFILYFCVFNRASLKHVRLNEMA